MNDDSPKHRVFQRMRNNVALSKMADSATNIFQMLTGQNYIY